MGLKSLLVAAHAELRRARPTPWPEPIRLDPNRARAGELALLDGIGPTRARAIVLHRVRHGPFREVADLAAVDGIGPITVERLAPLVAIPDD